MSMEVKKTFYNNGNLKTEVPYVDNTNNQNTNQNQEQKVIMKMEILR